MERYPTVRKLATSAEAAIKFCKKYYPGTDPVVVSWEDSRYLSKKFFFVELRPVTQQNLEGFGGVPHGTG